MQYTCEHCIKTIHVEYPNLIHAGNNESGYMYCNKCSDILTWSSYDKDYVRIVGEKHPWMLNEKEKKKTEKSVIKSDCGGDFLFSAKPRCPYCNGEIPKIQTDSFQFVVLGKRIDSSKMKIWIKEK